MAFCLCYQKIEVLFKMLYKINYGITLNWELPHCAGGFNRLHPDRAFHLAGTAVFYV